MNKFLIISLLFFQFVYAKNINFPDKSSDELDRLHLSAESGNRLDQFNLGVTYSEGVAVPRNYFEAIKWYKRSAEQGFPQAQYNLGVIYSKGKGVEQNYPEGMKWYKLAADQAHAKSQYNLGVMYSKGRGVKKDESEAIKWFKLASENGNSNAQLALCVRLFEGIGTKKNEREALRWCKRSAERNNKAQSFLGIKYALGEGVIESPTEAIKWFKLAAENGNIDAPTHIAFFYFSGVGVDRNYAIAKNLAWQSCLKGSEGGCSFHKKVTITIDNMIEKVFEKDSQCRGGVFETEEEMELVCSERDIAYDEAEKLGYCYGSTNPNAFGYEYEWLQCDSIKNR